MNAFRRFLLLLLAFLFASFLDVIVESRVCTFTQTNSVVWQQLQSCRYIIEYASKNAARMAKISTHALFSIQKHSNEIAPPQSSLLTPRVGQYQASPVNWCPFGFQGYSVFAFVILGKFGTNSSSLPLFFLTTPTIFEHRL